MEPIEYGPLGIFKPEKFHEFAKLMEAIRSCSRCSGQGTLEVDPIDGFLICTACGLVADEGMAWLQHDQPDGGGEAFANVDTSGRVKGSGRSAVPTAFGSSVGQGPSDTEHGRAYRLRKHLEHLEGVGSALHLPAAVIRDAGQILTEYRSQDHGPARHNVGALLGAALYVAARRADLGVVIPEVSAAAGVDARVVGLQYRVLSQALGIIPPRANLRSLVLRYAAEVVSRFYPPLAAEGVPVPAAGPRGTTSEPADPVTPGPSATEGGRAAGSPSSLRGHFFVQPALQLAELVARLRIDETRTINTQAAAVLQLVVEAFPPQRAGAGVAGCSGGGRIGKRPAAIKVPQELLLAIVGANKKQVQLCKKAVAEQLLELAHKLPFGASVHRDNVLRYLPTLLSFVTTLVALKKPIAPVAPQQQDQRQRDLAGLRQQDEPEAAAEEKDKPQTLGGDREISPAGKRRRIRLGDGEVPSCCGSPVVTGGQAVPAIRVGIRHEQQVGSPGSGLGLRPQPQGENEPVPARLPVDLARIPSGEVEEDDARVVLGLMTMEEVRQERRQKVISKGRREQPLAAVAAVSEAAPGAGTG